MSLKILLAKVIARKAYKHIQMDAANAVKHQAAMLQYLLKQGENTLFGTAHRFSKITNHQDFAANVPIVDYEQLKPYIEKIKQGEKNILWKGKPIYLAKTSGTTSGVKYIPITKQSILNHINTARNALLCYMARSGNYNFVKGGMIFLSGSPRLEKINGIYVGRLSGIVNHHIPWHLHKNRRPSFATNCIEDWETKLDQIVEETIDENITLISGIPPWVQMYLDKLIAKRGKTVSDIFPNFSVIVHGGVNYEPYHTKLSKSIGKQIDSIELFPASEGFFAFQDAGKNEGLLLNTNSGIFFEFVPTKEIFNNQPTRLTLSEVKLNENYALVISSNAGLWGYNIGDTIKFVSLNPYRIIVTGRIKHFISAFGEHVIGEEIEAALLQTTIANNIRITECTVAPLVQEGGGKSYHEWFIEFENEPEDTVAFAKQLDNHLREKNSYYDDLVRGNILQPLVVRSVRKNGFINYMKSIGKLGGQNKVPRLSNDRTIATFLEKLLR